MQFCALILFSAGFVELVIGSMIHTTVPNPYGAWWSGAGCVLAGLLGLMQGSSQLRSMGYCAGILCSILAVAGAIMDSIGYDVVKVLDTCASNDGVYGQTTSSAVNQVMSCRAEHENWDCTCINVHDNGFCYSYNLVHDKQNCLQILGTYSNLMHMSVKCLGFLVGFSIFYCIYLCALTMCPGAFTSWCFQGACVNSDQPKAPLANQQHFVNNNPYPPIGGPPQTVYVTPAGGSTHVDPNANQVLYDSHGNGSHVSYGYAEPPMAEVIAAETAVNPSAPPAPTGKNIV